MEKLNVEEILKIVDGCYYGQSMTFEENQLIKALINQQQKEINELDNEVYGLNMERELENL
ncbi:hypothetical protein [Priestia aryabhattai]|uniref:hypothetical protein n=1 Tax=Priestia aryabhattai TaxID=412384 RepID=UPI0015F4A9A4|nr:hypothetical protein [Priestia aryabhattai]